MALFRRRRRVRSRKTTSKNLVRQFVFGGLAIAGTLALGFSVWHITRFPVFTITTVTASGGETVSYEAVVRAAEQELSGTYLRLVPKRFVFFYPQEEIIAAVSAVSRVYNPQVSLEDKNTLTITFDEFEPYALWCDSGDESKCVFLNERGYAFAEAPSLHGGSLVRHMVESRTPEAHVSLFTPEKMERMNGFMQALEDELFMRTLRVEHTEAGDELYHLAGGGMLKVASDIPVQTTFDYLRSLLESDAFAHLEPGGFTYIDLRFGNRLFVQEDNPDTQATTVMTEESAAHEESLPPQE